MYPRPRWTDLGLNLLLCCGRSITDHLSHGMAPLIVIKVKVKESHNRPGVAQSVPGGLGSQISMTLGT